MDPRRPRRTPQPASPVSVLAVAIFTVGVLIAVSHAAPVEVRLTGAALATWGMGWCRATLHRAPRWTTRRILARAAYRTAGAVLEVAAREVRLMFGPPRGRRAVGSARRPVGAW